VVGIPDDRLGEEVKAFVTPEAGAEVTAEEIVAFAKARVAGVQVPSPRRDHPALPKSPTGEILKKELAL
jgi:long-chain acyl-CoA synthetase